MNFLSFLEVATLIYLIGFFISSLQSFKKYFMLSALREYQSVDLLNKRFSVRDYLVYRVIFWPYYLFFRNNPFQLISEIFFKHYGNQGHIYFGSQGLKNFFNDIFKGKNRYRHYLIKTAAVEIDKSIIKSPIMRQSYAEYPSVFANIICARLKKKYLLRIIFSSENMQQKPSSVSRYDLDECERLSKRKFFYRITELGENKSEKTMNLLDMQGPSNPPGSR